MNWFTLPLFNALYFVVIYVNDLVAQLKLLNSEAEFKQNPKPPSQYHSRNLDITLDLHVDDGNATGPEYHLMMVFHLIHQIWRY